MSSILVYTIFEAFVLHLLALQIIDDDSLTGWVSDNDIKLGLGVAWSGRHDFEDYHRLNKFPASHSVIPFNYTEKKEGFWWGESERISNTTVCEKHCRILADREIQKGPLKLNSPAIDDWIMDIYPNCPLLLSTKNVYSGLPYDIGRPMSGPIFMWFKPIYWQILITTKIDDSKITTALIYPIVTNFGTLNGVIGLKTDENYIEKKEFQRPKPDNRIMRPYSEIYKIGHRKRYHQKL